MQISLPNRSPSTRRCPPWASLTGFGGCVEWLPRLDEPWARLNATPRVGEIHRLAVRDPFCADSAEVFWALYVPALAALNGWDEHPEEIVQSALVACSLQAVVECSERAAIVAVKAEAVIGVDEIAARFPTPRGGWLSDMLPARADRYQTVHQAGRFVYLDYYEQGNCGAGLVCEREAGQITAILLLEWSPGEDHVYAGRRPLTDGEVRSLALESG
jgi:hypothetical protein